MGLVRIYTCVIGGLPANASASIKLILLYWKSINLKTEEGSCMHGLVSCESCLVGNNTQSM